MKKIIFESFNDFVQNRLVVEQEQLITEGQFSWFTQDTGEQIGSEKGNTIDVWMFDDEGNSWYEKNYEGYGEFGGMDYFELLARMNGYSEEDLEEVKGPFKELRQLGIDLVYGKLKTKNKKKKTLFPALVTDPRYNWKRHDFTKAPEDDPNQSWYVEPEDDYDEYDDDYYESARKNYSLEKAINEGNAFGAARAEAIANGEDSFEVDGETYPVEDVDAEDKENAEEFAGESLDLNEAFKSSKLRDLFNTKASGAWRNMQELPSSFYEMTNIALDQVEDADIAEMDPNEAHKLTKSDDGRHVIFYVVDNVKDNPYATGQGSDEIAPGILAVVNNNEFQGISWYKGNRSLGTASSKDNSIGISKKYKGWDSTGLSSPKRIAEVSDRAIVLDVTALRDKYSTYDKRSSRKEAKAGAVAFTSAKDFKKENLARYKQILADKAAKLPLDKMVKDAIEALTNQIQTGFDKNEFENGQVVLGRSSKGRLISLSDASNHMSKILNNYQNYVRYNNEAQNSLTDYYEEESKRSAKDLKTMIDKIEKMDYAW